MKSHNRRHSLICLWTLYHQLLVVSLQIKYNKIYYEIDKTSSDLSDRISKDLRKKGMIFVGTTIIYSYLQAIGIIYSHDRNCYLYKGKYNENS